MEVFKISCPQWQLVSSTIYSQAEMPDDKIERQQIENQHYSGKTEDLFRSFNALMANKTLDTLTLGAWKREQWT